MNKANKETIEVQAETMNLLKVPGKFWDDSAGRALEVGTEVRRAGARVVILATDEELDGLESDARFYADRNHWRGEGIDDLVASAERTLVAIAKYRAAT